MRLMGYDICDTLTEHPGNGESDQTDADSAPSQLGWRDLRLLPDCSASEPSEARTNRHDRHRSCNQEVSKAFCGSHRGWVTHPTSRERLDAQEGGSDSVRATSGQCQTAMED